MRGGYVLDRGAVLRRELLGRVTNEDPLRRILPLVNVALEDLSPRMQELYAPTLDLAGEAAASPAPAGVQLGSLGTAAD
jgi:hypothetical protein